MLFLPIGNTLDSRDLEDAFRTVYAVLDDPERADEHPEAQEELEELRIIQEAGVEVFGSLEWNAGVFLVEDSEFEQYAQNLAEDIGYIRDSLLTSYVDWTRWADDVKIDYCSIEIDGSTYWGRA